MATHFSLETCLQQTLFLWLTIYFTLTFSGNFSESMRTRSCHITISVKPGDLVLLKDLRPSLLALQWTGPHLVILTMPTVVKLNGTPQWQHLSRVKHCPPTSGSSTTTKDEYSCVLLGPMRLCLSHKLSPFSLHKFLVLIWLLIFCHRWI
jgi:hypothetical protein